MKTNQSQLLNFKQTCAYLNVKECFLRKLVLEKRIPHLKVGRLLRFKEDELIHWLSLNSREVTNEQ